MRDKPETWEQAGDKTSGTEESVTREMAPSHMRKNYHMRAGHNYGKVWWGK